MLRGLTKQPRKMKKRVIKAVVNKLTSQSLLICMENVRFQTKTEWTSRIKAIASKMREGIMMRTKINNQEMKMRLLLNKMPIKWSRKTRIQAAKRKLWGKTSLKRTNLPQKSQKTFRNREKR